MISLRKSAAIAVFALPLSSCGPSDSDVRSMVAQALEEQATVRHVIRGETIGPYSPAVVAGRFVFLSGQIGLLPGTRTFAGDDIAAQTRQTLENISSLLAVEGLDSSHVIQCTVYLRDINDFQQMNLLYGGYFGEGRYPARTTVEVSNLPAGALIEIAATAFKE